MTTEYFTPYSDETSKTKVSNEFRDSDKLRKQISKYLKKKSLETIDDKIVLGQFIKLYPKAFFSKSSKRKPLADENFELVCKEFPDVPEDKIRTVFDFYCSSQGYLKAIINGVMRVNLNGNQVQSVSENDKSIAKNELDNIIAQNKLADILFPKNKRNRSFSKKSKNKSDYVENKLGYAKANYNSLNGFSVSGGLPSLGKRR